MDYQSNNNMVESSGSFIDQKQWLSCLRPNSTDEGMSINPIMLTPQSSYSVPSNLPYNSLQYYKNQQQSDQALEIENPLDHPMINSLPNRFLKKLHCVLDCEILPYHVYWNTSNTSFTIRFENELVYKYLPQLFQLFNISSIVKLLTNYGFKKVRKQNLSIQTYDFQHPQFLPLQPILIDSIILESPSLDPYGKFIENLLNQFNYCKLNECSLKLEIDILEETNSKLRNELKQMRSNIEQLNLILYCLETGQFDKKNLLELNMLETADCYNQSLVATDPQATINISPTSQSLIARVDIDRKFVPTQMDFGLINSLTMSEAPAFGFISPTSLKSSSDFSQSQLSRINTISFGMPNGSFVNFY